MNCVLFVVAVWYNTIIYHVHIATFSSRWMVFCCDHCAIFIFDKLIITHFLSALNSMSYNWFNRKKKFQNAISPDVWTTKFSQCNQIYTFIVATIYDSLPSNIFSARKNKPSTHKTNGDAYNLNLTTIVRATTTTIKYFWVWVEGKKEMHFAMFCVQQLLCKWL